MLKEVSPRGERDISYPDPTFLLSLYLDVGSPLLTTAPTKDKMYVLKADIKDSYEYS